MARLSSLAAALVAASFSLPVAAAPIGSDAPSVGSLVHKVQRARDCHSDVRRHYVEELGRRVEHRHRGDRCAIVIVEPQRGPDRGRDCHSDVRRHFLREFGREVAHRHVGNSCRVRVYEQRRDPPRGGNCVRIGPVTYCEG